MGVVWRARDSRLQRDVAIKALPPPLRFDPARLARFEDEARAASALNHPNIVTIHEIGETNDGPFLVMELVEGKTLRELLYAGALPARRALHLAAQLSDALARAHEAGIVHRDLKPENVMVNREGFAKILDFGLAKFEHGDNGDGESRRDATLTEADRERAIVGTAGYMSPEQASGQAVDFHSDQFTFGALVYEMVSGRSAFHRRDARRDADGHHPRGAGAARGGPAGPRAAALDRGALPLQDAGGALRADAGSRPRPGERAGSHLADRVSGEGPRRTDAFARRPRVRLSSGAAIAVAGLVAAAFILGSNVPARGSPSFQRLTFRDGTVWSGRFAPDGRTVAYAASWNGGPIRIYTARPETPESSALPLPPSSLLAMSPSGEIAVSLAARPSGAFSTTGTLARSTLAGGAPREVMEGVQAADFSADGASLAVLRSADGRSRLEFPIGHTLYETASGYLSHPRVSPRGKFVAFLEHPLRGSDAGSVAVVSLDGRQVDAVGGLDDRPRARLVARRRRGLVHRGLGGRLARAARRFAHRKPAPGDARPGRAHPARRVARGASPAGAGERARGDRGSLAGRRTGAGPLLARLVAARGSHARRHDGPLRRDGGGRRRVLRGLPARDRRVAGGAPGRRPRAGALARREVGALDAAGGARAAGAAADRSRHSSRNSDRRLRRDPARGLAAGR